MNRCVRAVFACIDWVVERERRELREAGVDGTADASEAEENEGNEENDEDEEIQVGGSLSLLSPSSKSPLPEDECVECVSNQLWLWTGRVSAVKLQFLQ